MAVDANNVLRPPASIPNTTAAVTSAIRTAAQATGVNFDHLLATAKIESDLNPGLTMQNSSATGLFQFIDQTWLETLKQAGARFGLGRYADAITQTSSGRYVVADPALRSEIMALRKDPSANAVMGGAFTQQNAELLEQRIGRKPTDGELYIAHFFGPYAAAKVIEMAASNPHVNAAALYPAAARANRSIFYDKQGNARSIAGVYSELVRRYQVARSGSSAPMGAVDPTGPVPAAMPEGAAPDTAGLTDAYAAASGPATLFSAPSGRDGMFHSLFQVGARQEAISPAVSQLWSGQGMPDPDSSRQDSQSASAAPNNGALDLFQEGTPNIRGLFESGK